MREIFYIADRSKVLDKQEIANYTIVSYEPQGIERRITTSTTWKECAKPRLI